MPEANLWLHFQVTGPTASRLYLYMKFRGTLLLWLASCSCESYLPDTPSREPALASAAPPDARATGTLELATWNLNWLGADEAAGNPPRSQTAYERLRHYAGELGADVIALQEVAHVDALARVFDPAIYDFHVSSQDVPQKTAFAYKRDLTAFPREDFSELALDGLRAGADLMLEIEGQTLRLLSVHLKSGCFDAPLSSPTDACQKLAAQLPILESWIDARAAEGVSFAVLGDFNRRLFAGEQDAFWEELDDGVPSEADLSSPTAGRSAECWQGAFPEFIDHLLLSKTLSRRVVSASFVEQLFEERDFAARRELSDHCPLSVIVNLSVPRP